VKARTNIDRSLRVLLPLIILVVSSPSTVQSAASAQSQRPDEDTAKAWAKIAARKITANECNPEIVSDEIVVCGVVDEESPYRLPIRKIGFDPAGKFESVSRERNRLLEGADSGTGACSASGAGGFTGCMLKEWEKARQQRAGH